MDNNIIAQFNNLIKNNTHYYFYLCFIKNKDFLIELFNSLDKAIINYNQCKDYYYNLKIPNTNLSKNYSKMDIIQLFSLIPNININDNIYHNNYDIYDNFYLFYVYHKKYFLNLFNAQQKAITDYYKVKDFNFIFTVPDLIKNKYNIQKLNLDSLTMIKLYTLSNYNNYPLPIPDYLI